MDDRRFQILASVGTRLAIGAFPVAFVLAFGWAYGKAAFDTVAAANNWANYLNVLLLSGFVLVPPAVARLRGSGGCEGDRQIVRDHLALERVLVLLGLVVAALFWLGIGRAFPELAADAGAALGIWYLLFALLALAQVPMTFWLGTAQAAGIYRTAFACVAMPRLLALVTLGVGSATGAGPTPMLTAAVVVILAGQIVLGRAARRAIASVDAKTLSIRGRAPRVLVQNLSAGAIALVGTLVTIVPVTIVGRIIPAEVGHAHVIVTLSNAVGAVIVAAFFPLSLNLGERAKVAGGLWRHSVRVARGVALITLALIAVGWLGFAGCSLLGGACAADVFAVGSLVILGAGLRLGSLGAYHAAVYMGHPHYSLVSAVSEAVAVLGITWAMLDSLKLFALGLAFVVGGGLRLLVALGLEIRLLAAKE